MSPGASAGRVLVLGDDPQSIAVVRSLARAGFEVTLGTHQRSSSTARSRFVADVWLYDDSSTEHFCNHVEAFLRSERPDYVFPIGGQRLRALLAAGPRLEQLSSWIAPDFGTLARCFDRRAMEALVAGLDGPGVLAPALPSRRACHLAAAGGRLLAYFEEALPLGRSAAPSTQRRSICEKLLAVLEYHGTGCAMFAAGERQDVFLELVPGIAGTPELASRMGLDLPLVALQLSRGFCPARLEAWGYSAGKSVRWPAFEWGDPAPALLDWWRAHLDAPLRRWWPKRLDA